MARLPASEKNLEKSVRRHSVGADCATIDPNCQWLLLFYAAECGLKLLVVRRERLRSTNEISEDAFGDGGHDLLKGLKYLRANATLIGNAKQRIRHRKTVGIGWPTSDMHQAWRYGVPANGDDEERVIKWLKDIVAWVKKEMNW